MTDNVVYFPDIKPASRVPISRAACLLGKAGPLSEAERNLAIPLPWMLQTINECLDVAEHRDDGCFPSVLFALTSLLQLARNEFAPTDRTEA